MSQAIPLAVQISEVEREIKKRMQVYPGMVMRRRMRQKDADNRIAIMQEVLSTLVTLRANHEDDGNRC